MTNDRRFPIVKKSVRKAYRRPLRVLSDEPMGPHKREYTRRVYSHRDPLPLLVGDTGKAVAYACGTCGHVHSAKHHGLAVARNGARNCCLHRGRCSGCGTAINTGLSRCDNCNDRELFNKRLDRARKAEIIEDTGAPVCCEESDGAWGDGHSSSLAAFLEWWDDEHLPPQIYIQPPTDMVLLLISGMDRWGRYVPDPDAEPAPPPPSFVFATTPCTPLLDQDWIDEHLADDMHEDFDPFDCPGYADLAAAIERFNSLQKPTTYFVDYKRVIVIDHARFAEYLESSWDGTPDVRYQRKLTPARASSSAGEVA